MLGCTRSKLAVTSRSVMSRKRRLRTSSCRARRGQISAGSFPILYRLPFLPLSFLPFPPSLFLSSFPFLPCFSRLFRFLPFFLSRFPPFSLEVIPLKFCQRVWGSAVSFSSGMWGRASVEIKFYKFSP